MKLLIIRHAATQYNAEHRINGDLDEPLSDIGKSQLPTIVASLHHYPIDIIFSSPLKRTTATALPIAEDHTTTITIDRRLIEVDAGSLAGKTYDATMERFGLNSSDLLSTYSYDFSTYGGETSEHVAARVQSFLDELRQQPYNCVLLVAHGGINRWIYYLCTGQKIGAHPNGSILTCEW